MGLSGLLVGAAPRADTQSRPEGRWLAGDLHVHTTASHDSYGGPDDDNTGIEEAYTLGNTVTEQFAVAAARGLDYLAITDHNNVRSQSEAGFGGFGVLGVPSYENSLDGHAQMHGAGQVYDNDRDGDGDVDADDVRALADALRADGGTFQINHPAEGYTTRGELALDELDWGYGYRVEPGAVEVWNISRAYQPPFPSASSNDDAIRYWEGWLDRGARVAATGGSDNHYKATLAVQGPGQPTTWVYATEAGVDGVLDGIRAGRTFISHQPPTHGGPRVFLEADGDRDGTFETMVGGTAESDAEVRVHVENGQGSLLRVFTDGGELAHGPVPVTSPDWTSPTFQVPGASWVRADITEPDGAEARRTTCDEPFGDQTTYCRNDLAVLAMTSPIYLRESCPGAAPPGGPACARADDQAAR